MKKDITIEEIVEEFYEQDFIGYSKETSELTISPAVSDWLTQTLQAERQKRGEAVEAIMPWVDHDNRCILQRNEQGEPTEDGGYRTMYAGVWYKSGEEPDCDCGLEEALTNTKGITQ